MSEQQRKNKYFVLKELEVTKDDLREGDIFRVDGAPNQWWRVEPNDMAVPVVFSQGVTADFKTVPESIKQLANKKLEVKEKEDGQPREN